MKIKTQEEAKNYVKSTIKTGDARRIRQVLNRYRQKYWKQKTTYEEAKDIFEEIA